MNTTLIVLRALHIGAGVFWAGSILFMGLLLEPAIRGAGPEGGKVMRELQARKIGNILPITALIAILTGLDLLRRDFPGGPSAWFATSGGTTFVIGGSAAILVLILGVTLSLPTMKRMTALAAQMAASGSVPDPNVANELVKQRNKLTTVMRINVALVVVTVLAMATARYMG